eukprot:354507-Chlamydomonas_euryale.AAC.1
MSFMLFKRETAAATGCCSGGSVNGKQARQQMTTHQRVMGRPHAKDRVACLHGLQGAMRARRVGVLFGMHGTCKKRDVYFAPKRKQEAIAW